ncbi:MAG: imidazole glycerol phosphate synthase subunit HisF [Acidobacteria bacterium]|nr:imidazole glycerol phosphate synthase subunit HisF [Acidobacteriota bacterium]
MSLAIRVIPCLDIAKGRVVKGLRFENLRDAGDPVEAALRYEAEGADELTFLDIAAAVEERGTLIDLVSQVASVLSIPFTVGGGVKSVLDAGALLAAGADRVTINTAALANPALVTQLAETFGSQCVVVAVDGKRVQPPDGAVRMLAATHGGRRLTERDVATWAREVTERGAGEILLTSMDADGTKAGFDVDMLRAVRSSTKLPLVASGGAGTLAHFVEAVVSGGADAVLAASVFHDRVYAVGDVKAAILAAGLPVRPVEQTLLTSVDVAPGSPDPFGRVAFDERGLVPVIVRNASTGDVLTLAWANREALELTRTTGLSHFYSRSRSALWKKGETSGHVQNVLAVSVDCDGDAVLYDVRPQGPACHRGTASCFTETLRTEAAPERIDLEALFAVVEERQRNPDPLSYTVQLLSGGVPRIARKLGEEAVETILAAVGESDERVAEEAADLLYHLVVLLAAKGIPPEEIAKALARRRGTRRPTKVEKTVP